MLAPWKQGGQKKTHKGTKKDGGSSFFAPLKIGRQKKNIQGDKKDHKGEEKLIRGKKDLRGQKKTNEGTKEDCFHKGTKKKP